MEELVIFHSLFLFLFLFPVLRTRPGVESSSYEDVRFLTTSSNVESTSSGPSREQST